MLVAHDYLVFVRYGVNPDRVMLRHDIRSRHAYRVGGFGFGVALDGQRVEQLTGDPDVERIQRDDDRLAPHFRMPPGVRIEGEYLVVVRPFADPLTVATRAGVSPFP